MSDLFTGQHLIEIDVSYTVTKNKYGVAIVNVLEDELAAQMKADPTQRDSVRTLRTKWRQQSWKTANDLLIQATVWNHHKNANDTDWTKYRNLTLYHGLVEWSGPDVVDANGAPIPCTVANIEKLDPMIGLALVAKYQQATSPDQDTIQKN
jgi:hypothetical protein